MTGANRSQVKSLFLATVMVLSVIAIGAAGFAGSAAAQGGDIGNSNNLDQDLVAGSADQPNNRIVFKDNFGTAFGTQSGNSNPTVIEFDEGITVEPNGNVEPAIDILYNTGDVTVTGVNISGNTIEIEQDGLTSVDDKLIVRSGVFNISTDSDIDASNSGVNAGFTVNHRTSDTSFGDVYDVHKPIIDGSSGAADVAIGSTGETLDTTMSGLTLSTSTIAGQIGNDSTVTLSVNESDGITWDTSIGQGDVISGTTDLEYDESGIEIGANTISVPVTEATTVDSTITFDYDALAVNTTGDANTAENSQITATVEARDSTGTVDAEVGSNAEINVQPADTNVYTESTDVSVAKNEQALATNGSATVSGTPNVVVALTGSELGDSENLTLVTNNSDVTFDTSSAVQVEAENDDFAGADHTSTGDGPTANGVTVNPTNVTIQADGTSVSDGEVGFYGVQLNVSEGADLSDFEIRAQLKSSSDAPTVEAVGNEVYTVTEPSADFGGSDQDVYVDNGVGVTGTGVANFDIIANAENQINQGENVTITIPDSTGLTFDTSAATSIGDQDATETGVTVNETEIDIEFSGGDLGGLNTQQTMRVKNIAFNATPDAAGEVITPTVTSNTSDFDIEYDSADTVNVSTATVDALNFNPGTNPSVTAGENQTVTVTTQSNDLGGPGAFGGSDVTLDLVEADDDVTTDDVLNTTSFNTADDGTADFNFSADVATGDYVVNVNASNEYDENVTFSVGSGSIDSISVEGYENAFRGAAANGNDNLRTGVYQVNVTDSAGNLVTDKDIQVGVRNVPSDGSLVLVADGINADGSPNKGGGVDNNAQANFKYDASADGNQAGVFYVFVDSGVATENAEIQIRPRLGDANFDADSGSVEFYDFTEDAELDLNSPAGLDETVSGTASVVDANGNAVEVPRIGVSFNSDTSSVAELNSTPSETDTTGSAEVTLDTLEEGVTNVSADFGATEASGSAEVALTVSNATDTGSLTFNDQTLAADNTVTVEDVSTGQPSTVVVTYLSDNENVVAGTATADNLAGENVSVEIQDTGGFPGDHTAHVFNTSDLPSDLSIGDDATPVVDAALDAQTANITVEEDAPAYYTLKLSNSTADRDVQTTTISTFSTHRQSGSAALLPRSVYRYTRTHTGGLR